MIVPGLLILLALVLALHRIISVDLWLHLSAGRWILGHLGVPREEIFSFTAAGHKWTDLHWGYQILVALAHRAAGGVGIQLLHAAPLIGALVLCVREIRRRGGGGIGWLFVGLAVMAGEGRILCRPEMFSVLFLVLCWVASERMVRTDRWPGWGWIVLPIAWANMQGLFILGPAFMALRALGIGLDGLRSGRPPVSGLAAGEGLEDRARVRRAARRHLVVAAAMLGLAVINPYGINGLLLPFRLLSQVAGPSIYAPILAELRSPFEGRVTPVLFGATLAIVPLAWLVDRRRLADLLPVLAFAFLAISSRRNVLLFEILALVPTSVALGRLSLRWPRRVRAGIETLTALVIAVVIVLVAGGRYYLERRSTKETGLGFSGREYPVAATRELAAAAGGGRVFNLLGDGDYLIWHLGSAWRIFFDGRAEVYGEELGRELVAATLDERRFLEAQARYGFDALLIDASSPVGRTLIRRRAVDPRWTLRFHDGRGALFLPRRAAADTLIPPPVPSAPLGVPTARRLEPWRWRVSYPFEAARLGRLRTELGLDLQAAHDFEEAVEAFPFSPYLFSDYGSALLGAGEARIAIDAFDQALVLDDDLDLAAAGRARALEALGERSAALAWLAPWCEARPGSERAWLTLAAIEARGGDLSGAAVTLERASRRIPAAVVPLARILAGTGARDRAIAVLRGHLEAHPDDDPARQLLREVLSAASPDPGPGSGR